MVSTPQRLTGRWIGKQTSTYDVLALKESWKADFQALAAASGGRYLDAPDAESLRAALTELLTVQYRVFDAAGRPAGSGAVGGPRSP